MNELKTMNILCIDDHKQHLKVISKRIRKKDHVVYGVNTPEEAFEILKSKGIDCIVADYDLSNSNYDGIDFCKEARKRGFTVPVIFITSQKNIFDKISSIEGNIRVIMKNKDYSRHLITNIHNIYCKTLKGLTGSYWISEIPT